MPRRWTAEQVLAVVGGYRESCVLAAAAELEVFDALKDQPLSASEMAARRQADARGVTVLLDALVALGLLEKHGDRYSLPEGLVPYLTCAGSDTVLAMAQHQANCLRRWARLAEVVKTGKPAERRPSIRGEAADLASFIGAMDNISVPVAARLVADIGPPSFGHLLDVGGASGTWTIAFLRAVPDAMATIFDLPSVIPMAERRIAAAELSSRVKFVAGDFESDPLPAGADLAWVSAIIHQNSREQNRRLFAGVFKALAGGGRVLIRDLVMEESRTAPIAGALFAVNMLVGTERGGTFTFEEIREDLGAAGFTDAAILRRTDAMDSVVGARKPAAP